MALMEKLPRARPSHIGYVTKCDQVFYLKTKSAIQYEGNIGAQTKYFIRERPNGVPGKTAARGPLILDSYQMWSGFTTHSICGEIGWGPST